MEKSVQGIKDQIEFSFEIYIPENGRNKFGKFELNSPKPFHRKSLN